MPLRSLRWDMQRRYFIVLLGCAAAKELGLALPPPLIARADEVIE
jgi:hypothetical protein